MTTSPGVTPLCSEICLAWHDEGGEDDAGLGFRGEYYHCGSI